MVGVAQLVERRVVVADVAGSSPVVHPGGHEAPAPREPGPSCVPGPVLSAGRAAGGAGTPAPAPRRRAAAAPRPPATRPRPRGRAATRAPGTTGSRRRRG